MAGLSGGVQDLVELAIAKGKKNYDKRHALRERQDNREADRAIAARRRGED